MGRETSHQIVTFTIARNRTHFHFVTKAKTVSPKQIETSNGARLTPTRSIVTRATEEQRRRLVDKYTSAQPTTLADWSTEKEGQLTFIFRLKRYVDYIICL